MNNLFGTTAAIDETAISSRTRGFFKATLSFLLIFLIGSFISNILLTIPTYILVYSNSEYMDFVRAGVYDFDAMQELVTKIINDAEWLGAATLISTAGTIIAVIYFSVKFDGRRIFSLGFVKKGAFKEYISGVGIGIGMFTIVAGIIIAFGGAKIVGFGDISPLFFLYFIGYLIQGMSEEVLLRGYYFTTAASKGKVSLAVFISSAAFSLLHAGNNGINLIGYVNIFLFGVFAALYFLRRGSIWGISAIHSLWNFTQGNIFNSNVSGNALGCSLFKVKYSEASTLLNDGAFGPEGGIAVTIVLFLGILVLLFFKNKDIDIPEYKYKGEFYSA